jgi:hypothetical protein
LIGTCRMQGKVRCLRQSWLESSFGGSLIFRQLSHEVSWRHAKREPVLLLTVSNRLYWHQTKISLAATLLIVLGVAARL